MHPLFYGICPLFYDFLCFYYIKLQIDIEYLKYAFFNIKIDFLQKKIKEIYT